MQRRTWGWPLAVLLVAAASHGCTSDPPPFAYAVGGSAVAAYRIDPKTGALKTVSGSPFTIPERANGGAAVTPSGRFLYVGHRGSGVGPGGAQAVLGSISAYAIDASGGLTPVSGSPFQGDGDVRSIVIAPGGRLLYAVQTITTREDGAVKLTGGVRAYAGDPTTGALTPTGPVALSLRGLAFDGSGRVVFALRSGTGAVNLHHLVTYPIDGASGALTTPVAEAPFPEGEHPEQLVVTPSGRVVYVLLASRQVAYGSSRDGRPLESWVGSVAAYLVDPATGTVTRAPGSPILVGSPSYSRTFTLAPSGRFIFVADEETPPIDLGSVWGYGVDESTGALMPLIGSPVRTAVRASAVTVDRTGRFIYVTSIGPAPKLPGRIWAYAIDPTTSVLTPVPGAPFASAPVPTAVVTTAGAR